MNINKLLAVAAFAATASCVDAQESADTLRDVVVTGTRNATDVRHLPLTITTIDTGKLEENYRASVIPTVMEQTPGLFNTSRGMLGYGVSTNAAGAMKVRGVGGNAQLLVLIDGQPQYAGLMGHPIADAYQTVMAERVEVLRGPASLLYGSNAMGGVVNIVTRKAKQDGVTGSLDLQAGSYGTVQANGVANIRQGRWSGVAGVSYGRTDGHRTSSAFEQFSNFYKLGYDISDQWAVQADLNLTNFIFNNPGPVSAPLLEANADITRGLASVSVSNDYGHTNGSLRAYYDWGRHSINDGHRADAAPKAYLYKQDDFIGGVTWYQSAQLFDGNRTTVGLDWQHFGGDAWNAFFAGKNEDIAAIENQDEVAAYIDFRQSLVSWLTVDAGLRYDHHTLAGTELVPQGGVALHLNSTSDLKALVSKGFRNPTIREMYMFPPANKELEPERMVNYELSYTQRFSRGHVGANLFYIDGENLIVTAPNPNGAGKLNQNIGEFENWGVEVEGDYRIGSHWSVNANYSYLHQSNPVEGAPEHKAYLGGSWHSGRWAANAGVQHVAGLYLTTGDDPLKESFTLVNATLSFKVAKACAVFAKGENLLAESYSTYLGFPMPRATAMGGVRLSF